MVGLFAERVLWVCVGWWPATGAGAATHRPMNKCVGFVSDLCRPAERGCCRCGRFGRSRQRDDSERGVVAVLVGLSVRAVVEVGNFLDQVLCGCAWWC